MTNILSEAEYKAALNSIDLNGANFQVFSFSIALAFFIGFSVIAGSTVVVQTQNQNLDSVQLVTLMIVDIVLVAIIIIAFTSYLRNIGRYIFSRVRPTPFDIKA